MVPKAALNMVVKLRLPTLFARRAGRKGEEDKIKGFFQRQEGVIAVSEGQLVGQDLFRDY